MAERTDQLTEDSLEDDEANEALSEAQAVVDQIESGDGYSASSGSTDVVDDVAGASDAGTATGTDSGGRSWLPSTESADEWFSPEFFVVSLVGVGGAAFLARSMLWFLGRIGGYAGLFLAAFVLALASSERRYLEIGAASLVASGLFAFLANLSVLGLFSGAPIRAALTVGAVGTVTGLLGAYLGRDLRSGLTQDVGPGDDDLI